MVFIDCYNKLFRVEFEPIWPVPHGLLILAKNIEDAKRMASETLEHTDGKYYNIHEIDITKEGVVFYESGDY